MPSPARSLPAARLAAAAPDALASPPAHAPARPSATGTAGRQRCAARRAAGRLAGAVVAGLLALHGATADASPSGPSRPARDPGPAPCATPRTLPGDLHAPVAGAQVAGANVAGTSFGRASLDPLCACGPERGCGDLSLGAHGTLLPNLGASLRVGRVVARDARATWSLELELGAQPLDDKDLIDSDVLDGQPSNRGYAQALLGLVRRGQPAARRHWVWRAGAFVLDAGDEPNWVDTPGTWAGAYVGVGLELDLTPALSVGPMLTLLAGAPLEQDGNFDVVPQLSWGVTWWPGARSRAWDAACPCRPRGELYVDLAATLLPGVGQGAVGLGQVVARTQAATWSFETLASFQHLEAGTLQADGDGDLAQLSGGLKATLAPHARTHLVLRAGATWLRATAPTRTLGEPGDWVGAYAGVGWEWDVTAWLATGPEAQLGVLLREGLDGEVGLQPRLAWRVVLKL